MKDIPDNVVTEKNKVSTASAWIPLLEITLTDGTVYRVGRNNEDIAYRILDYEDGGCIAHWKLDETSGVTIEDESDNNLDGVSQNDASGMTTTGKVGTALNFDGSTDYITVSDPAGGELDFGESGDFSISAWFKTSVTGANQVIVSKGNYWVMVTSGNVFQVGISDGVGGTAVVDGSSNICDGEWHHIAGTFDRSGVLTVYLDGSVEGTPADITGEGDIDSSYDFYIGVTVGPLSYFNGDIDNVAIFNRVLSAKEVEYLYNSGSGTDKIPVLYTRFNWQMDSNTQTTRGQIPTLELRVSNVSLLMSQNLKDLDGGVGSVIKIIVVNSSLLYEDFTELEMEFDVLATKVDSKWITFTLGVPSPLRQRFPLFKYFANHCSFTFTGGSAGSEFVECGYVGAYTTCDRTLSDCRQRGNQTRFGGFPGMRSGSVRII